MVVEQDGHGTNSGGGRNMPEIGTGDTKKKRESASRMVPFLSKKSVITLVIGLMVGVGLGIGYWAISPKLDDITSNISTTGVDQDGPHECTTSIQIMQAGSSYMSVKELQYQGEYYAAKANTLPFFEYLSQELDELAPQYSHTAEELDGMMLIRYDWNSDTPGTIEIMVTGSSAQEAYYLAGLIPHAFRSYLAAEESKIQQQEYEDTLAAIETIKVGLFDAENELANVVLSGTVYDTDSDPDYIALQATITALETELENQAAELASFMAGNDTGEDYYTSAAEVERLSNALAEYRDELATLAAEGSVAHFTENREYVTAQAKVDTLNRELTDLTLRLTQYSSEGTVEPSEIDYLVIGMPSDPVLIPPDRIRGRNAAMIGGICGIGIAWVAVNRKWIMKQLSSSGTKETDEGMRDEA
jgi:hypothetical protein